jgi:Tfp pilus assembly protein PilF
MDIFPEDISPVLELVIRLGDLDQNEQANRLFDAIVQHYEKHLAVSPEDADALNNIAWLCALTRQHLDRAVVYAEKATKLQPNTSAYLDTLAEIPSS